MRPLLPFVTVVVPVCDDLPRLRLCAAALREQSYPADRFELVVVDNGSARPVGGDEILGHGVRVVQERARGSYAARNTGIATARGEVLAFTDSDCIPDREWLERGVETLLRFPDGALVGGRVDVFADPRRPANSVELCEMALAFRQRRNVEVEKFAVTANAFVTRGVIERVGAFEGSLLSGGDREWGQRVYESGFPVVYAEQAVVKHPARASLREIGRKMTRVARGHHSLAARRSVWRRVAEVPRIIAPPAASIVEIWRCSELKGISQRMRASAIAVSIKYIWAWARLRCAMGQDQSA